MHLSPRFLVRLSAAILLLLCAAAVANRCRPVNRVRRATLALLDAAPKTAPGPDAPLALVRALAPYQKHLDPAFTVAVPDLFEIRGRDDALQALQLLRRISDSITLGRPALSAAPLDSSRIRLDLTVPLDIQFSPAHASWTADWPLSPTLRATLDWTRTNRAWRLQSATLCPFSDSPSSVPPSPPRAPPAK